MPPDVHDEAAAPALTGLLADVAEELRTYLLSTAMDVSELHGQLVLRVPASKRAEALAVLKVLGFEYYSWACGVDWPDDDKLEVFDHVESIQRNVQVTLKCEVPRSNPRVPTGTSVYAGADWHEREAWELFGIVFVGHPRLRRLLLPDWQEGFPMRKDALLRARIEKPWPGEFFSG